MWKLSVVVAHQSTGKLFPAAGLYGGQVGLSRHIGRGSKFLWRSDLWIQGSGVSSVWLLVCFRSYGVSLELSIIMFGYFSIKLCLSDATGDTCWSCWSDCRNEAHQIFFPSVFWQMCISDTLPHFWCKKCFVQPLKTQRKGLGRSGLVSIADPWDFCTTGPKHMGSNPCLGVFIGFLGARNSSCSVKLNPLWNSI